MNFSKFKITVIFIFSVFLLTGCQQFEESPKLIDNDYSSLDFTQKSIPLSTFASKLNLEVADKTSTYIKLTNSANTVMIFTFSDGGIFVNGKEVAKTGEIASSEGTFYFDESLVGKIKPYLLKGRIPSKKTPTFKTKSGTVIIDPGHGGKDPGAISVRKYYEKNINLIVSKKVAAILRRQGVDVIMTRHTDEFIELNKRAAIANRHRAKFFVSIHADAHKDKNISGCSVYIARSASRASNRLARSIYKEMLTTGFESKGVRRANYRVLVRTRCPAVLIEMGYLSNYSDSGRLLNKGVQNEMAKAIARGIINSM